MKRNILLVLGICLFPLVSIAQTTVGNLMVGGHFSSKISRQEQLFIINATPNFGVFVTNHLAVGGLLDIGLSRYGTTNKHNTLGIMPTARFYPGRPRPLRPFFQAEAGYHRVNLSVADIFIVRSGLGLGAGAGFAYFFNQTVSMEGMFRLRGFKYTDGSSALQNSMALGLQVYIPSYKLR